MAGDKPFSSAWPTPVNALASCSRLQLRKTGEDGEMSAGRGVGRVSGCWRKRSCDHLGETAPLFCCINLLFSTRSPARSFDPLLDHPLDDSLTAKEIKYIGLTTDSPLSLSHPPLPLPTLRRHCLPPHLLPPLFSPRPPFLQ